MTFKKKNIYITPLFQAVFLGNNEVVNLLLKHKNIDVNLKSISSTN